MRKIFRFFLVIIITGTAPYINVKASELMDLIPCSFFPADNIWNTPIDEMPLNANSDAWVTTIGATKGLHPDFGSGLYNGAPMGIPFVIVPGNQPKVKITFDYADESDPGPYPIPPKPPIEGGDSSSGDRHILVLDKDNCLLYGFLIS